MKLVYIIVSSDDDERVMESLNKSGFSVTKMASTGGFLRTGNTTIIVGTEEEKVDNCIEIVKNQVGPRQRVMTNAGVHVGVPSTVSSGNVTYPVSVDVGGATIFVVDIEKFVKI